VIKKNLRLLLQNKIGVQVFNCHVDLTGGSERSENDLKRQISKISASCHDHTPEVVFMSQKKNLKW
jgi:acetolactate synthase regulatory subunit